MSKTDKQNYVVLSMVLVLLIAVGFIMTGCDGSQSSVDINGTQGIQLDKNTTSISNMVNVSDINISDNGIFILCTEGSECSVVTTTTNAADNNSSTGD